MPKPAWFAVQQVSFRIRHPNRPKKKVRRLGLGGFRVSSSPFIGARSSPIYIAAFYVQCVPQILIIHIDIPIHSILLASCPI